MYSTRNFKLSAIALLIAGVFTACSSDDSTTEISDENGRLGIYAQASYTQNKSNDLQRATAVELSRFLVNIEEIELEYESIVDEDNFYGSDDEIELRGPFELNLLSSEPIPIVNINIPRGVLEEVEFEFDKNNNQESDLYNQSMRMEGTINGIPFVFWHDFEEEIELEFDNDNSNGMIIDNENTFLINFDLNFILDGTAAVDMSTAVDGDGNGIIEISPRDNDGNRDLAEAIKQAIKNQIDVFEDLYD